MCSASSEFEEQMSLQEKKRFSSAFRETAEVSVSSDFVVESFNQWFLWSLRLSLTHRGCTGVAPKISRYLTVMMLNETFFLKETCVHTIPEVMMGWKSTVG